MRVVLFSHEYPPFLFGGVGVFVKDLAHGLASIGLDVTVIAGYPSPWKGNKGTVPDDHQDNITTIRLPYPNLVPRHITFQLYNRAKIVDILKSIQPDVIHGQSGSAFPVMLSIKKFAPLLITFHGSPAVVRNLSIKSLSRGGTFGDFFTGGIGYPAYEYCFRAEYKNAKANVAVSKSLLNQLISEMNIAGDNFQYIHNGVDLRNLDKLCSEVSVSDDSSDTPTLLFGGRLFWSKGVMDLVDLAYLLEKKYNLNFRILVYGTGPMRERIMRKRAEYGLSNLILRDFASRSDFLLEMRKATFVIIPSPFEAAPMVLLESMCMGKIPVMFNLPYSREFTENGKYGVLCDNVSDMAIKIKELYNTKSNISLMEKEVRTFARQNYSIAETANAYLALYKKLLCN